MSDPLLVVDGLEVRYPDTPPDAPSALHDVSLTVEEGAFVAVIGPSGSGKSTLLRAIAGLVPASRGTVRLRGTLVRDVPERLGVVFQDYARSLFPWMTVGENVEMPLRHRHVPPAERRTRVTGALDEVGLRGVADRHPWQLSGGMQQRVAIARAIAVRPELLLMDEPFGSVDAQTREDLQDATLAVWRAHRSTCVFVTHDIDESVYLADRVVVLSDPPTTVVAEVPISLRRPRDPVETRADPEFVARRSDLARMVRRPRSEEAARG